MTAVHTIFHSSLLAGSLPAAPRLLSRLFLRLGVRFYARFLAGMVLLFDLLKRKQASSESSADGTAAVPSDVDVAQRKVARRPIGRSSAWACASHLDVVDSPDPLARASRSGPTVQHGPDGGGSVGSRGRLLSSSPFDTLRRQTLLFRQLWEPTHAPKHVRPRCEVS